MKTLLFILVVFTAFTSAQTVSAKAELSVLSYDFGKVKPGEKLKYELFVKNIGKLPVIIKEISTSRTYISAEWFKGPIMPGKERLITLTISVPTKFLAGLFEASIEVFYNNFDTGPLKFKLFYDVSK
ncbi:MAG: DUF1573 domain-containing protein [Ignavibacteriaceae bacterium]|nr:DUF1573 domain-containing protein [Ignavibacteriaceae bacterium]